MTLVIESLQAFVLDRPPIVAFFFSLIAITMTIFLVAFYIKEKDLVLDPHTQEVSVNDCSPVSYYFNFACFMFWSGTSLLSM